MANPTKSEGGKPRKSTGGAASTPMVKFVANRGISGPGYHIPTGGGTGDVPKKYAEIHVAEGHGEIKGEVTGND